MRPLLIKFRGEKTQKHMAYLYKVTQQTWSNWEKGIATPAPRVMKKIEKDSGYKMEEVFADCFQR